MKRLLNPILALLVLATLLGSAAVGAAPKQADRGAWAPGVSYAVGDTVTYNGVVYKCLQAHTSQTGWEPPNVPALWQAIGTPTPGGGATNTPTRTNTPAGATATRTPTRTNTPSGATATRTPTRTNTPAGATATRTPTRTNTPAGATATSTPTRTNTPSGGNICTAALWNSKTIYLAGDVVYWNGHQWRAKWWTQGEEPPGTTGVWEDLGACSGGPTVGPTPTPGVVPPPAFPSKVFAPYVDVNAWPTFSFSTAYSQTGQKYYTLAFVIQSSTGSPCTPAWGGAIPMSENYLFDEINYLRSNGGNVIVSFGGANGTELAQSCSSVSSLQAAYQAVIDKYKLNWIDFDIEGTAVTDTASIDRRNKAIAALQAANPGLKVAYCLPVLPSGLTQDGLNIISNAKSNGVRIDLVNVMAMDYGDWAAPNPDGKMGQYAIDAATNTYNQMLNLGVNTKIGVTPMIGQNDIQSERFYLTDAQQLVNWANSTSWVTLLAFWSANRDNGTCAGQTSASPKCSGLSQADWAFINIFKQFTR